MKLIMNEITLLANETHLEQAAVSLSAAKRGRGLGRSGADFANKNSKVPLPSLVRRERETSRSFVKAIIPIRKLAFYLSPALLCIGLAGCSTPPVVQHLSSGYGEVTHPRKSADSPADTRVSFEYREPDGKTILIWPSLYGVGEVIKGDVAIFVGDKAYVSSDADDPRGTKPRLFAVQAPGLPLDITDEVLWYWSKASGKNFEKAVQLFNLATPAEKGDKLEVQLEFWMGGNGWPENATLQLDWNQVSDIMRTVKEKGTMHKDLRWGTSYIEN